MCYKPIKLIKRGVTVPCGKCPKCIARRVSGWSFRLLQEEKISLSAHFITLTYDSKYVPITSGGLLTLFKRDTQLFFKRLRKAHEKEEILVPIKYYLVGEYGGRTLRPHYHAILFNAKLELINDAWKRGHIYYGSVSGASVGYTLKYMSKQKKRFRISEVDDRLPEFALMSKGLGSSYLNEVNCNWHVEDLVNRMYCTVVGGVKLAMPRYYKDKLYFELEKSAIRDAYAIINNDRELLKISRQTTRDLWNEQASIDAAFDKMYFSSLKTKL